MKIYISGPMTGIESYNFPAFFEAAEYLREKGHEPINPAEIDVKQEGLDTETQEFGNRTPIDEDTYREYLSRDLGLLGSVDAVAALPGWESSNGATLEIDVARRLGIPVLKYPDLTGLERFPGAPLGEDIHRECESIKQLLIKKNRAYKNSALQPINVFSKASAVEQLSVRIDDKLKRISEADPNALGEDSILDLIGYLILLRIAQKVVRDN